MQPLSYDELWVTAWGDQQNFGPVHRHQQKNLIRTVSNLKVRSLLEVGCGSGNNLATQWTRENMI